MARQLISKPRLHQHPYVTLASSDSPSARALERLTRCVPMPVDSVCLQLVCGAAKLCLESAINSIPDPTDVATELLAAFTKLAIDCEEKYTAAGLTESLEMMRRRLTTYPAWYSLAFIGSHNISPANSTLMVSGMEMAIKLVDAGTQPVAPAYMRSLATDSIELSPSIHDFIKQVHFNFLDPNDLPVWYPKAKKNYKTFIQLFSKTPPPPPPPPPPTFEEKAAAQIAAHAVFAKFHLRAGVIDTTMLSLTQVEKAFSTCVEDSTEARMIHQTLLWFSGFSGLTWDMLGDIPLLTEKLDRWVVCVDIDRGVLQRDLKVIARDSSKLQHGEGHVPSSYICSVPMPESTKELLNSRRATFNLARKLSDLLPELENSSSRASIYQTPGNFQPSFARLAKTMGPLMRQQGIVNLLTAIVTGNFGNTAKSKLYYCNVAHGEIWDACRRIYDYLKLGSPVEMPTKLLNFGTGVVSPADRIKEIDSLLVSRVENLRSVGKATAKTLIEYHNTYVTSMAFRFMFLLGLREAKKLMIWADIDELHDLTLDVADKKTNSLEGALPVVLSTQLKTLIQYYRLHCRSLCNRLKKVDGHELICDWLEDVLNSEHVPLLCMLTPYRRRTLVGTSDVIHKFPDLAPDFGRKFLENWLRTHTVMTRDIDRQMRHEVLGQESYTCTSAHSELNWIRRMRPVLDTLASELFVSPLAGLRTKL